MSGTAHLLYLFGFVSSRVMAERRLFVVRSTLVTASDAVIEVKFFKWRSWRVVTHQIVALVSRVRCPSIAPSWESLSG